MLDVNYGNGGDDELFRYFKKTVWELPLYGYAGWNTAGNSLGTILAQLVASKGNNSVGNRKFTLERLLDDLFYESVVRPELVKELKDRKVDVHNIQDVEAAENLMQEIILEKKDYLKHLFGENLPEFEIHLFWPRTFETMVTGEYKE